MPEVLPFLCSHVHILLHDYAIYVRTCVSYSICMHTDCTLQESKLALHSEGIKMTVASEQPHFLAVDDDAFSMGVVLYHIKVLCALSVMKYYNYVYVYTGAYKM